MVVSGICRESLTLMDPLKCCRTSWWNHDSTVACMRASCTHSGTALLPSEENSLLAASPSSASPLSSAELAPAATDVDADATPDCAAAAWGLLGKASE